MTITPLGGRGMLGGALGRGYRRAAAATGWWLAGGVAAANCIAAYQAKGASSLAASYTNLASPGTYNAAPGVAPTWNATSGWIFNGSNQYLKTGVIPAAGWSALIRFSDLSNLNGFSFGSYGGASAQFRLQHLTNQLIYSNGGSLTINVATPTSGVLGFAGQTAYRNGSAEAGVIPGWSGTGIEVYIAARNSSGSPGFYIAAYIQAFSMYNTVISEPQGAAISAAMAAL